MDDALFVRGCESLGNLNRVVDGPALRQWTLLQHRPQALALEQFGDQVWRPVVLADVVDREDVRVIQHCDGARLLCETAHPVPVSGE
jgi:hypothetical protein